MRTLTISDQALLGIPRSGSQTFSYTGAAQTFVVPAGVTSVTIDAIGGGGGDECAAGNTIPKGGRVQCTLAVTPGETLQVNVGGVGGNGELEVAGAAGWNGGGAGAQGAGGGGGATDVRQGGPALVDRKLVAGGAGGNGGNWGGTGYSRGGDGGGATAANGQRGYSGPTAGLGGGVSSGGGAGVGSGGGTGGGSGSFGVGGVGGTGVLGAPRGGGGGGGGWYGGGGGGGGGVGRSGGGGGGGSSYAGSGTSSVTHTQGYGTGNGLCVIMWEA